jgi:hypothetical protein
MRTVLLALGVAVVLVLAACGGDNGGDDPRQVAERFIAARADNDGQAMCELLTAEAQAAAAQNSEDGSCADGMALNEGDSDIQEFSYYTVESRAIPTTTRAAPCRSSRPTTAGGSISRAASRQQVPARV